MPLESRFTSLIEAMDGLKPRLQRSIRLGEQMFACFAAKTGLKTHKKCKIRQISRPQRVKHRELNDSAEDSLCHSSNVSQLARTPLYSISHALFICTVYKKLKMWVRRVFSCCVFFLHSSTNTKRKAKRFACSVLCWCVSCFSNINLSIIHFWQRGPE